MAENTEKTNKSPFDGEVDVIVLGVGSCGEDLSLQLLNAGLKVVGIGEGLIGGECAYWACIPTKMMIRAANSIYEGHRINRLAGDSQITPNWDIVAKRIAAETSNWNDQIAIDRYKKRGGYLVKGHGKLTGPRTVSVGDETFTARYGVVIATGSSPFIPPVAGLSDVDYWTTHDIIQLKKLPKSLTILGGGAVGCEIGQMLGRFGVQINIVERSDRLLHAEEPEASKVVEETLANEGVAVHTGSTIERVKKVNGEIITELAGGKELKSERLLVALGRKANISELGLESVGLNPNGRFLEVDERLRAGDGIWGIGDVTGKGMFTHVALNHSAIVASDILGKKHAPARYDALPRVTFTDPEVASVGMTEAQALKAGIDVVVTKKQMTGAVRGWVDAVEGGVIKLITSRNDDVLIGATIVGPHAGELLGMLTLAIHSKIHLEELRSMIYAYPTFYGGIGEALGAYGRGMTSVIDPQFKGVPELDLIADRG